MSPLPHADPGNAGDHLTVQVIYFLTKPLLNIKDGER